MSSVSLGSLTAFTTWSPFGPRPVAPVISAPPVTRRLQNLVSFTNWMPFGVSNEFDCGPRDSAISERKALYLYLIKMLHTYAPVQNESSFLVERVPIQVLNTIPGSKQLGSPCNLCTAKLSAGSDAVLTSSNPIGVSGQNSNSSFDSGKFSSMDSSSSSRSSISENSEGQGSNASMQNNVNSSAYQDPWVPKTVFPSSKFPSMSITPTFNLWSPSSEDDIILDVLSHPSSETDSISSDNPHQRKNSDTSTTASSDSASNQEEWGVFSSWSHIPTRDEAEILHAPEKGNKGAYKVYYKTANKKSGRHHWRNHIKTKMQSRRRVRSS